MSKVQSVRKVDVGADSTGEHVPVWVELRSEEQFFEVRLFNSKVECASYAPMAGCDDFRAIVVAERKEQAIWLAAAYWMDSRTLSRGSMKGYDLYADQISPDDVVVSDLYDVVEFRDGKFKSHSD